jgi:uncharacterized protein
MPRTGVAYLPLHGGSAPRWLFDRMVLLSRQITLVIVEEFGPGEMLARLSDPHWFQAFGCLLGFDWHSSGLTTVVCGALKQALLGLERDTGLLVAGGKGATSRKTPSEIERAAERFSFQPQPLVYASRMAAKVDSAALQDGYQIYHHTFLWMPQGRWAVVQQGLNPDARYARRYHWLSDAVSDFVVEPHNAIISESLPPDGGPSGPAPGRDRAFGLNMVAAEAEDCRALSARLSHQPPENTVREIRRLQSLVLPSHHHIHLADIRADRLERAFRKAYEANPRDFEQLLGTEGVGPKSVRALALTADLVYGARASFRDPARFSFAHGGKDGHPYPVDRRTYDRSIEVLRRAVHRARIGRTEKMHALRRLTAATSS